MSDDSNSGEKEECVLKKRFDICTVVRAQLVMQRESETLLESYHALNDLLR